MTQGVGAGITAPASVPSFLLSSLPAPVPCARRTLERRASTCPLAPVEDSQKAQAPPLPTRLSGQSHFGAAHLPLTKEKT